MASISLCMIVKNEEEVLGRCLDSVSDLVDEIIIVDTGSVDETKRIASVYTDKVETFPWIDDFAAARNFAFQKGTGDYLFWLDADDVITEEEQKKLMKLKMRLDQEKPDVDQEKPGGSGDNGSGDNGSADNGSNGTAGSNGSAGTAGNGSNSNGNNSAGTAGNGSSQTGDAFTPLLWAAIMLTALALMGTTVLWRRKQNAGR